MRLSVPTSVAKVVFGIGLIGSTLLLLGAAYPSSKYDVKAVYVEVQSGNTYYATLSSGEGGRVERLFQKSNGQSGTFSVRLTRMSKDFYRVDGTSTYIETRYCYEYGYGNEATLTLYGYGGYSVGTVEFD